MARGPKWEPGTLVEPPVCWARSRRRSFKRLSITRAKEMSSLEEEGRSRMMSVPPSHSISPSELALRTCRVVPAYCQADRVRNSNVYSATLREPWARLCSSPKAASAPSGRTTRRFLEFFRDGQYLSVGCSRTEVMAQGSRAPGRTGPRR